MSFNKYYIPDPDRFAELVKQNGPKSTVTRKIDAMIGSSLSTSMFEFIDKLVYKGLSDPEVMLELSKKYPKYFGESN